MPAEIAAELRDAYLTTVPEDLLGITIYTDDTIDHVHLSDDVKKYFDQISMDSLQRPILNLHRTLNVVSRLNPYGGSHRASVHYYEHVIYVHLPVDEYSGVIVSLKPESDHVDEVVSTGVEHVYDSADSSSDSRSQA